MREEVDDAEWKAACWSAWETETEGAISVATQRVFSKDSVTPAVTSAKGGTGGQDYRFVEGEVERLEFIWAMLSQFPKRR